MSRVAIDCRLVSDRIDGLGRYTLEVASAVARDPEGFEVTFVLPITTPEHPARRLLGLPGVRMLASAQRPMAPTSFLTSYRTLRALDVDIYHYPHFNLPLAAPRRTVITIHDVTPLTLPDYFETRRTARRLAFWMATFYATMRASAVIVPSTATQHSLSRLFPWVRQRLRVIHEGVSDAFRPIWDPDEVKQVQRRYSLARPFLLYVGVTRPHKNLERLLHAFGSIADRVPHDLVLVGQSRRGIHALRTTADRAGVTDRVRWLGYLPQTELPPLYRAADAFVLCSLWEGFGLPVIEAMSCGTAVVASNIGALAETAGEAAERVDPLSVSNIAAGLLRVCLDVQRRNELRELGVSRAAHFTWERAAHETLAVYKTVARA